ncbi:MAG: 1-deoxy-D-xylulose-5-phosphate reductoisomerase [Planctomycetia bacterium]|nr:1-deoxy-D-xylulose-5-phosphate reductoisomerase [Planctomycetia bacterium]
MKKIAIFGSTGSIGRNTLEIISSLEGFSVVALSGNYHLELLQAQAWQFRPRWIIATDKERAQAYSWDLPSGTELLMGSKCLEYVAQAPEVDMVVSAIVGRAGLESTVAAVLAGKRIALANKESLVIGGQIVTKLAHKTHSQIIPVDSEHSAIFQALQAGRRTELRRVILTASGGAFRDLEENQLRNVTLEAALNHPTWEMGAKVTLDSATLMNKALEIIEARWLFDLHSEEISVMIHPQSVVHSMVEFQDGSVISQMSPPDMRLPIQYALTYPQRLPGGPARRMDWEKDQKMEFFAPDFSSPRYEALQLGLHVARQGGSAGVVLNAANELAVEAFRRGKMRFDQMVPFVRDILYHHDFLPDPSLEDLIALDEDIRRTYKSK